MMRERFSFAGLSGVALAFALLSAVIPPLVMADEPPAPRDKTRVRPTVNVEVIDDARQVEDIISRLKARAAAISPETDRAAAKPAAGAATSTSTTSTTAAKMTPAATPASTTAPARSTVSPEPSRPERPPLKREEPEVREKQIDRESPARREQRRERERGAGRRR